MMMEYRSGTETRTNVNGSLSRRLSRPMVVFISFEPCVVSFYACTVKPELSNATKKGSRAPSGTCDALWFSGLKEKELQTGQRRI
jgi:hypothetical protein